MLHQRKQHLWTKPSTHEERIKKDEEELRTTKKTSSR